LSVNLHVRDTGEGEPVLLLHGWPDTGDVWRHQAAALVAAGYRAIVPDQRGFGASDRPADVQEYGPRSTMGDVIAVLDRLALDRVHLVGHDLGAGVAWTTASVHPDRVASLTALSAGHPVAFRTAGLRQLEKSWYILFFQFPEAERWLSADGFRNFRAWAEHPDADEVAARLSDPAALTATLGTYRAVLGPNILVDPPPRMRPVQAPALGIWGSNDFALVEAQMTGSAAYVAGSWRYERLDGAGHWLQLDAPGKVSELILGFLRDHPIQ